MSQNPRLIEITLIRVEGLNYAHGKSYTVKCILGKASKTIQCKGVGTSIELEQHFVCSSEEGSKLCLKIFPRGKKKKIVGELEKDFRELVPSSHTGNDLVLHLTNSQNEDVGVQVIIRLKSILEEIAQGVVDATENELPRDGSKIKTFKAFLTNLRRVANIVSGIAEINPYAKAAVSLALSISNVFTSQIDRDEKIMSLVDTMNDTYMLVLDAEDLHKLESESYRKCVDAMLKQTIECGYFIQGYARSNFVTRAMKAAVSPKADQIIASYKEKFNQLRQDFQTSAIIDTSITVCRIMDDIQTIGVSVDLDDIMYAEGMRFDTSRGCLPSTRTEIREEIINWANSVSTEDANKRVFLLTGLAGSGKSTIAHSVASHFDVLSRLASSFFCSRAKAEKSRAEMIFCTIARDIADRNAQVKEKLWNIVKNDKALRKSASVPEQFAKLIKEPISNLEIMGPMVIVIDALDECEGDPKGRKQLMRALCESLPSLPANFRIFLTARNGDSDLEDAFETDTAHVRRLSLDKVLRDTTDRDISAFIGHELPSKLQTELVKFDPRWQQRLAVGADGSFIWASTACMFIAGRKAGLEPWKRLEKIVDIAHSSTNAFKPLYSLYEQVLDNALDGEDEDTMERYRLVLGTILTAFVPLSTIVLDDLTSVECRWIVSPLGAVLTGSTDKTEPVEVLHESFRDYLSDLVQSKRYFVNTRQHHSQMAKYCLCLMIDQFALKKFNLCGFEDLYVLYDDIPEGDLLQRIEDNITDALQYACRYWPAHIAQMDPKDYDIIKESLNQFLFGGKHLMKWVEVVSLLKMMGTALKFLRSLVRWFNVSVQDERDVHQMLYDCFRFLNGYSFPITRGPLQVYHSALAYIPANTMLNRVYGRISGLEPRIIFGQEKEWSMLRSRLPVGREVKLSGFSIDGALVACVTAQGLLQIFDFATSAPLGEPMVCGAELGTFSRGYVPAIVFSPDRKRLAMNKCTSLEVWNIEKKAWTILDSGYWDIRSSIVFLSDRCVATCVAFLREVVVRMREVNGTNRCTHVQEVDEEVVCTALSPTGCYFGCVTTTGTVWAWDVRSQVEIAHFRINDGPFVARTDFEQHERYHGVQHTLGISSEGDFIVASDGRTVTAWGKASSTVIWSKACPNNLWIQKLLMPTECGHFVTAHHDHCQYKETYVWNIENGGCYRHESSGAEALSISPDGLFLVTNNGEIYIIEADAPHWEPNNGAGQIEAIRATLLPDENLRRMLFLQDGSLFAEGGSKRGMKTIIWDQLGTMDVLKQVWEGHTELVGISADRRQIITREGNNVFVHGRKGAGTKFELEGIFEDVFVESSLFLKDGGVLLAGVSASRTSFVLEISDVEYETKKYFLEEHTHNVRCIKCSPDGMLVASWDDNNHIYVSARRCRGKKFTLIRRLEFRYSRALNFFGDPLRWGGDEVAVTVLKLEEDSRLLNETSLLAYDRRSAWIMNNGKRIWWIPHQYRGSSVQLAEQIVVYSETKAVSFKYADSIVPPT